MSGLEIVGNKMEKDWEHVKDEPDAYYTREWGGLILKIDLLFGIPDSTANLEKIL